MRTESFFRDSITKHAVMQAERLVDFLNGPDAEVQSWHTMQVFDLCKTLDEVLSASPPPTEQRLTGLRKAINDHLREFQVTPVLGGSYPLFVSWHHAPGHSPPDARPLTGQVLSAMPVPSFHPDILRLVLDMTEAGTVGRIRKCICGKWFFAQSNKKQVCSNACRFQKYQTLKGDDPNAKEKHAAKMKKWRKDRDVRKRKRDGKAKAR